MNISHALNGPTASHTPRNVKKITPLHIALRELASADRSVSGARLIYTDAIQHRSNVLRDIAAKFGNGPHVYNGELVTIVARKGPFGVSYFTRTTNRR
jgi:hypothetical protein